jgi:Mce-associated membrane protein
MSNATETLENTVENTDSKPGRRTVRVTRPAPSLALSRIPGGWRLWLVPLVLFAVAAFLFAADARHDSNQDGGERARKEVVAHVEKLLSYDYREIEDELARERDWLTGSFADDYTSLVSDEIAKAAKKVKVVTEARVSASGVVSAEHDEVELLLFVNVTTRSSELAQPRVSGSRLAVTAKYVDGEWRISALDPV